ncbi:MAG TPA: hypothetical protein VFD84_10910 [Candidatus Binatia bacterium]|nr:hypothetical protein [Candidatus Binatia bacterium]
MPAAPARQPSPKSGVRFVSARSPRRLASRASIDGTATPVTVVEKTWRTSAAATPAASSACAIARAPRSSAQRSHAAFASANDPRASSSSTGSARWRPSTPTAR